MGVLLCAGRGREAKDEDKTAQKATVYKHSPGGSVYLAQTLHVQPYRCYRIRSWVKTEDVAPREVFHLWVIAQDGRDLAHLEPWMTPTSDWHELVWAFNSWNSSQIDFRIGVSDGQKGKVWVDDVQVEEVGLTNILRRPGTPVKVANEKTGRVYEEGRDFSPIADAQLNFRWDHEGPAIKLLPGSRVHPGDRLRVDYFHGTTIYREQVPIDMSEPAVYEIWQRQIPLIERYIAPKKYFLSMDEVRIGGFCEACKRRRLSMAQILGDTVTRQHAMIRAANPQAQVYVWSDMFDPNHNAVSKYYLIDGSFEGTWDYIPKDLIIGCWNMDERDQCLGFFSKRGHRTLAAAYYDADDLENSKDGCARWTRRPALPGSCIPPGRINTVCWAPSAIWSQRGKVEIARCQFVSIQPSLAGKRRLRPTIGWQLLNTADGEWEHDQGSGYFSGCYLF